MDDDILEVLQRQGAVMKGHFLLSSGRHSDVFAQKFRVLEHPELAARFGTLIAARFDHAFDVVVSPAVGAIVLGFCTAQAAGTRFIFAERTGDSLALRRGFELSQGERALVVEDVITTGGSAAEVVQLVGVAGADVVGVGALIDREDPARADLGARLEALVSLPSGSWAPDDCPACARGVPLDDPGSRRLRGA